MESDALNDEDPLLNIPDLNTNCEESPSSLSSKLVCCSLFICVIMLHQPVVVADTTDVVLFFLGI